MAVIEEKQLNSATDFVKESLGVILHDDKAFYENLYVLKYTETKRMNLRRTPYFYKNKGALISQLNMSAGENLLLTILNSIENRLRKEVRGETPTFIFLDEVELALHSSALRRLAFFS